MIVYVIKMIIWVNTNVLRMCYKRNTYVYTYTYTNTGACLLLYNNDCNL